jgi:hypothetical protein
VSGLLTGQKLPQVSSALTLAIVNLTLISGT